MLDQPHSSEKFSLKSLFLWDTGSNAHIASSKRVFEPGSLRQCDVSVYGISDDDRDSPMKATECGDVNYILSNDLMLTLKGVLYLPGAVLGEVPA